MAKYLVVAHQTVTSPRLLDKLRQLHQQDPAAEFTLLVPATPIHHLLFFKGGDREAETVARDLATEAAQKFREQAIPLTETRIGAHDPREAVDTELAEHSGYAGIVISTLAQEHSRWLLLDLPKHVETTHTIPIHHVIGPVDLESDAY